MTEEENSKDSYSWNKFSEKKIVTLEKKILEVVKTAYKGWFVNVGKSIEKEEKIWTVAFNSKSKNTPLVLLHGFGAGVGFWCLNFDAFAKDRPVYAIDILGFGRSSRPTFSQDNMEAEIQLVDSIEEWRKEVNLDKFILLGHSFGGYLATSYTLRHPEHVKHLILADPWGFNTKPPDFNPPLWLKTIGFFLYPFTYLNPLATVRAVGPFGPWLIKKMRSDISEKYATTFEDKNIILEYIYQCNSQKPSGETAFHSMMKGFGWAKNPMVNRVKDLNKTIPMTIIYGANSWISKESGVKIMEDRPDSLVEIKVVPQAGHHLYVDEPETFNFMVVETCLKCDGEDYVHKEKRNNGKETDDNENFNLETAAN
ncbi:unnamed protein product [Brassicogethes aeneus]|uniref:1-acylglycerol-3-phosphate O-acyltransferase ABHD5 n=1 Tax=Brassicogethes aeneus TaxID=1431903 RepID=A0A9P0FEM3_BRAAE|nr:unnamed protein product [Brassicogethes aeneus]